MKWDYSRPCQMEFEPRPARITPSHATAHGYLFWAVPIIVIMLVGGMGCRRDSFVGPTTQASKLAANTGLSSRNNFDMAVSLLDSVDEQGFDTFEAQRRIAYHFQQWADNQKAVLSWVADPLYGRLPSRLGLNKDPEFLSRLSFTPYDVMVMREAAWLRNISNQAIQRGPIDPALDAWLADQRQSLDADHWRQLDTVLRLFDWVVRNLQLAAMDPPLEVEESSNGELRPRPGARQYAWEALLKGRGDAWARARVFIRMARQQRIPVLVLGFDAEPETRPWLTAARVGGKLYLFDTRLGLPVPGPDDRGVATLQQVVSDPTVLRQLDVDGETSYPATQADLKRIVAMIDASAESLSQRMKLVESALSGDQKMILTCVPSALSKSLRQNKSILRVEIWPMSYDVINYHFQVARDPHASAKWMGELRTIDGATPLARARRQHFRGVYHNAPPQLGAKTLYLRCRISRRKLEQSRTDLSIDELKRAGLEGELPEDPERLAALLESAKASAIRAKQAASYWLGIIAYEDEQFDVAVDYFQKRTLDAFPDGPWTQGAHYNLGRTYEIVGRRDADAQQLRRAIELYTASTDSPQRYGNLIRARRLSRLLSSE